MTDCIRVHQDLYPLAHTASYESTCLHKSLIVIQDCGCKGNASQCGCAPGQCTCTSCPKSKVTFSPPSSYPIFDPLIDLAVRFLRQQTLRQIMHPFSIRDGEYGGHMAGVGVNCVESMAEISSCLSYSTVSRVVVILQGQ